MQYLIFALSILAALQLGYYIGHIKGSKRPHVGFDLTERGLKHLIGEPKEAKARVISPLQRRREKELMKEFEDNNG